MNKGSLSVSSRNNLNDQLATAKINSKFEEVRQFCLNHANAGPVKNTAVTLKKDLMVMG